MMKYCFSLLLVCFINAVSAQPYADEIAAFKKMDSISFPVRNQILFIGSSSFRLLRDTSTIFPGYAILNRAFGGSTLEDVIRWRYETIYPYQPKQIVMYCGENDLASSDTVTVQVVVKRFKTLFQLIRAKYPAVPFVFVSIKPSPSRIHLINKVKEVNQIIQAYLKSKPNTKFVNVFDAMLNADGTPDETLFKEDRLHMNPKGYAIWKQKLMPVLLK
ncbi:GDSL-type esterase/lipase family protein [Lacibacter sp. MH-610]|uniref:GDSL-type esterase/lipase family protein n=1 Tax=Lacibacter sp. MH-610 TaxID=3020883 RepID=UPI003892B2FC